MKPRSILPAVLALAASASAATVNFRAFDESVALVTDVVETPSGPVTATAVGISDYLSPTAAADLAADPATPAQLLAALSVFPQVSDYQFLALQGLVYIVLNDTGPALNDGLGDVNADAPAALVTAAGSGYTVINLTASSLGTLSYTFYGFDQNGDEEVGTVNFNLGSISETEQPVSPAPEPSTLALCIMAGLACCWRILASVASPFPHFTRRKGALNRS